MGNGKHLKNTYYNQNHKKKTKNEKIVVLIIAILLIIILIQEIAYIIHLSQNMKIRMR